MPTSTEPTSAVSAFETTESACLRAMGMLASGRAWFVFLISLAILLHVGLFVAAHWGDVLQQHGPATQAVVDSAVPADEEPSGPAQNFLQAFWPPQRWEAVMRIALPIAGFVALACSLVLIVLAVAGIQINLVGRLPATATMISAFYWSLITAALLLPWGSLVGDAVGQAGARVPWLFFTCDEITRAPAPAAGGLDAWIWMRFLAWPALGLLATWITGARFGKAYWQVVSLAEMESKARIESSREI